MGGKNWNRRNSELDGILNILSLRVTWLDQSVEQVTLDLRVVVPAPHWAERLLKKIKIFKNKFEFEEKSIVIRQWPNRKWLGGLHQPELRETFIKKRQKQTRKVIRLTGVSLNGCRL